MAVRGVKSESGDVAQLSRPAVFMQKITLPRKKSVGSVKMALSVVRKKRCLCVLRCAALLSRRVCVCGNGWPNSWEEARFQHFQGELI